MKKFRDYKLTEELLEDYQNRAVENAFELLQEAKILSEKECYARAYFLALASIEETGKAQLAFNARGWNFDDEGLCKKIKEKLEDHSSKISSAFMPAISLSGEKREALQKSIQMMIDLKNAREKTMYVDVKRDGISVSYPKDVVRKVAAIDCVRLAEVCNAHARVYFSQNKPEKSSPMKDKLYCIKSSTFSEIVGSEDFVWYYIEQMEQGKTAFEEIAVTYHDCFYKKNKLYKSDAKS